MNDKELIWVKKEMAERYKAAEKEENKRELQIKIFEDYLQEVADVSKSDFKANLETLDEDIAIYTGLMLKVKQAFEKAKDEQLDASYKLWEKFEENMPNVKEKIGKIIAGLNPLQEKLTQINDLLGKINTWNIEKLGTSVEKIAGLYGKNKEMVEFLVNNFKETK